MLLKNEQCKTVPSPMPFSDRKMKNRDLLFADFDTKIICLLYGLETLLYGLETFLYGFVLFSDLYNRLGIYN